MRLWEWGRIFAPNNGCSHLYSPAGETPDSCFTTLLLASPSCLHQRKRPQSLNPDAKGTEIMATRGQQRHVQTGQEQWESRTLVSRLKSSGRDQIKQGTFLLVFSLCHHNHHWASWSFKRRSADMENYPRSAGSDFKHGETAVSAESFQPTNAAQVQKEAAAGQREECCSNWRGKRTDSPECRRRNRFYTFIIINVSPRTLSPAEPSLLSGTSSEPVATSQLTRDESSFQLKSASAFRMGKVRKNSLSEIRQAVRTKRSGVALKREAEPEVSVWTSGHLSHLKQLCRTQEVRFKQTLYAHREGRHKGETEQRFTKNK